MINIPYTSLVQPSLFGGQTAPQFPTMPAARGQAAQAMGNVTSALNSQRSQAGSILDAYMNRAPAQPQPQLPDTHMLLASQPVTMGSMQVPGYGGSTVTLGGGQMQMAPMSLDIKMPQLPQSDSLSSYLPDWLSGMFAAL